MIWCAGYYKPRSPGVCKPIMDSHLGYEHGDRETKAVVGNSNSRNGSYTKRVDSNYGPVDVSVPRDREGSFIPMMLPKGSRRLTDVDELIISLYAGGMTIRDIQHHMVHAMGVDISHETISAITDAVLDEVMEWQNRQLDEFYPVIFLDAMSIKVRYWCGYGRDSTHPWYLDRSRRRRFILGRCLCSPGKLWNQRCLHRLL